VHLLFLNHRLALCDFVPRPFDFHPEAVPISDYHSNVDSDEVLYYAGGEFMSRRGIAEGSITLHPAGMPHGPQPGKVEESLGRKATDEWAVMVDAFEPLRPTVEWQRAVDEGYPQSWLEKGGT
jgi:homogentisate 1,2-dioxygenase